MNISLAKKKPVFFTETNPQATTSQKIYPKRIKGKFRTFKWWSASLYLLFFFGPYLRWNNQQAILLDIPARKFHFFDLTIYPQDVWILSFILLFFAMLLILVTVTVSRAFCGYFCFQTVWTDIFTWIEEKIEGSSWQRQKLDQAPWNLNKIAIKTGKHSFWLLLAGMTGVSFAAWFTDVFQLWQDYIYFQAHISAWIVLALFTGGTYLFAGFMREQVCNYLCPYARIQGALSDQQSILPNYDYFRGEPRSKLKNNHQDFNNNGDCIDCNLCVAVCPTGVDIRQGEQLGCITCGLCIDACDEVMEKLNRPRGLIRYDSFVGIHNNKVNNPCYKRPLVVSTAMLTLSCAIATLMSASQINPFSISVSHHRQPDFIKLSNGDIRNRYQIKLQNKTNRPQIYKLKIIGLPQDHKLNQESFRVAAGEPLTTMLSIDASNRSFYNKINRINFQIEGENHIFQQSTSVFITPL